MHNTCGTAFLFLACEIEIIKSYKNQLKPLLIIPTKLFRSRFLTSLVKNVYKIGLISRLDQSNLTHYLKSHSNNLQLVSLLKPCA